MKILTWYDFNVYVVKEEPVLFFLFRPVSIMLPLRLQKWFLLRSRSKFWLYCFIKTSLLACTKINSVTLASVSYTHLDVYKRQLYSILKLCSRNLFPEISVYVGVTVVFCVYVCGERGVYIVHTKTFTRKIYSHTKITTRKIIP